MYRLPRLRLVLLTLLAIGIAAFAGCGSDSKNPTGPGGGGGGGGGAADVTIGIVADNGANSFSPASASCMVGQKVSWKNNDSVTHHIRDNGGAFDTGVIAPGATSAPITMNTAASFPYKCTIHPAMTGTLTVNP